MVASKDPPHAERLHTPEARSIREIVFGVNDGLVSVTGIVIGVTASRLSPHQILISGLAAVVAATVSMGLGQYLSTAAQNEYFLAEREREAYEVETVPDEERREVEAIWRRQGFNRDEARHLTDRITQDRERWISFMMREELGILLESLENPWRGALVMAAAVVVGSVPPILPYLVFPGTRTAMVVAIVLASVAAFGLGVLKARVARGTWWKSGFQFFAVTGVAIVVGSFAGHFLGRWLG
jgi:VIT1/CCC1 family predicted Fe2+/Mn2+ transporter